MNGSKGGSVNAILVALVALLIGFIGGYLIGRQSPLPAGTTATQATAQECPHNLPEEHRWILAGFRCPGTAGSQVLLLDCHCHTAHGIMDQVKSEIAAGRTGDEIRQELVDQYGDQFKFAGQ